MDTRKFVKDYDKKINEVVSQDAVRAETVKREIESGIQDEYVANASTLAAKMYVQAINDGFNDEQAFDMAMRAAGLN